MRRMRLVGVVALMALTTVSACGGDDDSSSAPPAAVAVKASGCSPVSYGGEGRPDFLIGTSTVLTGAYTGHGIQVSQALKMVLDERDWRAGDYSVGLQICGETSRGGDLASPARCRRNARLFARNRSVLVVHGPLFSSCAAEMIPILNRAPGGPLAQTAAGPTYLGLTRPGPGVAREEPDRFYPTDTPSFVRIAPPDDATGAAGAVFAQQQGARAVFALNDGEPYGFGVAEAFALAAEGLGLEVAGRAKWDAKASHYRALAERVRRSGADAVYLGGYVSNNGAQLIKDLRDALGPEPELLGPDAFNNLDALVEGAGAAAEGFAPMIAVLPNSELPDEGREFASRFEERFGARPCCFSVHTAQTAHMMLDAIAQSGGSRTRVLEHLFETPVEGGYVGDFEIDRYGDTTLSTIAVYRLEDGRLRFKTAITPPRGLLARR
jgi:branched-chain amino acid transport system substrate-binding protein